MREMDEEHEWILKYSWKHSPPCRIIPSKKPFRGKTRILCLVYISLMKVDMFMISCSFTQAFLAYRYVNSGNDDDGRVGSSRGVLLDERSIAWFDCSLNDIISYRSMNWVDRRSWSAYISKEWRETTMTIDIWARNPPVDYSRDIECKRS